MEFTIEELLEMQHLGENIKDNDLVDGLIELANREKSVLDSVKDDPEMRAIIVHCYTILAAAAARILAYQEAAKSPEERAPITDD